MSLISPLSHTLSGLPDYKGVTDTWDIIQSDFKCCGSANYTDWAARFPAPGTPAPAKVPDSCCTVRIVV